MQSGRLLFLTLAIGLLSALGPSPVLQMRTVGYLKLDDYETRAHDLFPYPCNRFAYSFRRMALSPRSNTLR